MWYFLDFRKKKPFWKYAFIMTIFIKIKFQLIKQFFVLTTSTLYNETELTLEHYLTNSMPLENHHHHDINLREFHKYISSCKTYQVQIGIIDYNL